MVWLYQHRRTTNFRCIDIVMLINFMVWLLVHKRLIYKILYFETRLLKYFSVNQNDLNVFNTVLLYTENGVPFLSHSRKSG